MTKIKLFWRKDEQITKTETDVNEWLCNAQSQGAIIKDVKFCDHSTLNDNYGYDYTAIMVVYEMAEGVTDKEIVDKLIELTDGTIDHFDIDDAVDLLYEVKTTLSRRAKHEE